MKISKAEKEKNYHKIIEASVKVITKEGFKASTMKDIAKAAGIADATIYKYFATKESILHAYFEIRMEDLVERLQAIPDFQEYSFQEQFHALIESNLELFARDRAFVKTAYENVFLTNWINAAEGSQQTKERFFEVIDDLIQAAVEIEEFPEPPFKKLFYELLWDYCIGITYYWLKDESPKYTNTTTLIDKSLAMISASLKSGILNHAVDLFHFLVREHLLSRMKYETKPKNLDFDKAKRKFMASTSLRPKIRGHKA